MKKDIKLFANKLIKNKKLLYVVIVFAIVIGVSIPIICISGERHRLGIQETAHNNGTGFDRTIIALEKKTQDEIDTTQEELTQEELTQEELTQEELEQIYSDEELEEFFGEEISTEHEDSLPVKPRTLTSVSLPYDGVPRNISCWGDSMTEGFKTTAAKITVNGIKKDISYSTYPSVLQSFNGIKTYNLGVSGESSRQIASRQGGWKMYTNEEFTISAGSGDFSTIMSQDGDSISLSDFSGYYFESEEDNLCMIGDYWGYLVRTGDGYTFTLKDSISVASDMTQLATESTAVTLQQLGDIFIPAGTQIKTAASIERADDILIIEMGSNGGWRYNYQTLIEQYDAMIESVGCKYYIIIGDTDNPGEDEGGNYIGLGDTSWEATLREAYGDHFINMRTYLIENSLNDCGLKTNKRDLKAYAKGYLSTKIRSDETHFNAYGYYSKGIAVYKKGVELGYWK